MAATNKTMDTGKVNGNDATTAGKLAIWHEHAGQLEEVSTPQVVEVDAVDAVDEVVVEDAARELAAVEELQM